MNPANWPVRALKCDHLIDDLGRVDALGGYVTRCRRCGLRSVYAPDAKTPEFLQQSRRREADELVFGRLGFGPDGRIEPNPIRAPLPEVKV